MANLNGMLSFLDKTPEDYAKLFNDAESPALGSTPNLASAPEVGAPEFLITPRDTTQSIEPKINKPKVTSAEPDDPTFGAPIVSAPEVSASTLGAPELDAPLVYRRSRPLYHRAVTAQDGHTHGEQALFATLWRLARPVGSVRMLTTGERTLALEVPMAYSTVQTNLRSLVDKLAIEIRSSKPNQPKTYIVYSYEEILQRRRSAGLTHIVRRTSGVSLVNPGAPTLGAPELKDGAASSGAPKLIGVAPSFGASGAPSFRAHIKNKEVNKGTSSSVITEAITQILGFIDDDAVQRLTRSCRHQAPDATDEEIAHFAADVAQRIARMRGIGNPIGLLITQLPRCFTAEALLQFRTQEQARKAAEEEQGRQDRMEWERMLQDPEVSEEDKTWIRQALEMK